MNILMLSWNCPTTRGGIERLVGDLQQSLIEDGSALRFVTGNGTGNAGEPGVRVCPVPGVPAFLVYAVVAGLRAARRSAPDLIVCSSIVAAPAGAVLGVFLRVPYVVLVHGTEVLYARRRHRRVFDSLIRRAAMLIANSRSTARLLPAAATTVTVVHPGVHAARFCRSTPPRGPHIATVAAVAAGRPVLLSVGRLVRRKGILEFVQRVVPRLVEEFPDLVYLVAGDDPTRSLIHQERPRATIERAIADLGLRSVVRLLGAVSDDELQALYRRADLFVLPCLEMAEDVEGFGIAVLEAAAAGVPTVATRVGGIPEVVCDGVTGLLVAPGDDHGMEAAIRTLLRDVPLRRSFAATAAARVRDEFDWSVAIERYTAALESCLRATRAKDATAT